MLNLANTLAQLRRRTCWERLTEEQLLDYINEAGEQITLLSKPKDGSARVIIRAYHETLTLPRGHQSLLGVIRNKVPIPVSNNWYEFVASGPGEIGRDDYSLQGEVLDLGDRFCCFLEPYLVNAAGCRLKIYTDALPGAEVEESLIRIQGTDADGDPVRTSAADLIYTGEMVTLLASAGFVTTTAAFSRITSVTKPPTNGRLSVYAVDPDDDSETLIAIWEPGETVPGYKRYKVPAAPDGTDSYDMTCLCQRRHVDASEDGDTLCTDSFSALHTMMLSLWARDQHDAERAAGFRAEALALIGQENLRSRPASQYIGPIENHDEMDSPTHPGY